MRRCAYILIVLASVAVVMFPSCKALVHEWPGEDPVDPTLIEVNLHFHPADSIAVYDTVSTKVASTTYLRRYKYEIYADESFDTHLVAKETVLRELQDTTELYVTFTANAKNYRVALWQDFVQSDGEDVFYRTEDGLEAVHVPTAQDYTAGDDYKDVQDANLEVSLHGITEWHYIYEEHVAMERPVAKITFVTTDLESYLENAGIPFDPEVISRFRIVARYQGYLPTGFNCFTGRLNDSTTGYSFESRITYVKPGASYLGFDHVFVNGDSSSVTLDFDIYNDKGEIVNQVTSVKVPIVRGAETVVMDKFMTKQYAPGIGIDPGFDGEFNIYY